MHLKTLLLATALTTLPAGAALAQSAAAPEAGAAQTTTQPAAEPAARPAATPNTGAADAAAPNAAKPSSTAPTALATAEDVKAGVAVFDSAGVALGTIEEVTDTGAVIVSGDLRAQVPTASFGKNDRGLVIGITKAQFEAAVNQAAS